MATWLLEPKKSVQPVKDNYDILYAHELTDEELTFLSSTSRNPIWLYLIPSVAFILCLALIIIRIFLQ